MKCLYSILFYFLPFLSNLTKMFYFLACINFSGALPLKKNARFTKYLQVVKS